MELRTPETDSKYRDAEKNGINNSCFFCDESRQQPVKEFNHFKLVENDFPYDAIAEVSHLLFPKRHIREYEYTKEEIDELNDIKTGYLQKADYNYLMEGITKTSIPAHIHYHAIRLLKN